MQDVFFRAGTREEASRLALRGHARNLADGTVEVIAAGTPSAIDSLHAWLRQGPPHARVSCVDRCTIDPCDVQDANFATR